MEEVVRSLSEAARGVDAERSAGRALAAAHEKECSEARAALLKASRENARTASEAREGLEALGAAVRGLEADVRSTKERMRSTAAEIGNVTQRLRKLREARAQMQNRTEGSLQQVRAVMSRAHLRERDEGRRGVRPRRELLTHMSHLHELGSHLSLSADAPAAASFIELESTAAAGRHESGGGGAAGVLGADRREFLQAREAAMKGFDEEEAKLLDMLGLLRGRVKKLEADLSQHQPSLADKVRQLAETNMTVVMAERANARNDRIGESLKEKCDLMAGGSEKLDKLRNQLSGLLWMPAKLLQKMDTVTFLARDLEEPGETPPQLLQVSMGAEGPREGGRRAQAAGAERREPSSGAPPGAMEPEPSSPPDVALLAAGEQALEAGGAGGDQGPFDGVQRTIRGLLASLREESNQDVTRQQWCADSKSRNLGERLAAADKLDTLASEARWAKAAMARLAAEASFSEGEAARLRRAAADAREDLAAERSLAGEQLAGHARTRDLVTRTLAVVRGLCDLGATALLQRRAPTGPAGCADAARLMEQAVAKLHELDEATLAHREAFGALSAAFEGKAEEAARQQEASLAESRSASAKRANELAIAEEETKRQKENVRLLAEAKNQLEKSCGPHAETAQERLQRRAEEVEALKGALAVLEGQAVPA